LFFLPVPWVAQDLFDSINEYRILDGWSVCSGVDPESGPGCLASEEVIFEGPQHSRRSALRTWHATGTDGEVVNFDLLPKYDHYAETLPGRGLLYRTNGEVVAVEREGSTTYAPTALSGSHATSTDIFLLLMLLGMFVSGVRTATAGLLSGLGWADPVPARVLRGRRIDTAVGFVGAVGTFASFNLAKGGFAALVLTGLTGAAVLLYPYAKRLVRAAMRLLRQRRGVGRHAA
jgi:hypothetical protein